MFHVSPSAKAQLWHFSAMQFGVALPFFVLGKGAFYFSCVLALITGLIATQGNSLRNSVKMLWQQKITWLVGAFLATATLSGLLSPYPETLEKALGLWPFALACGGLFLVLREMPQPYVRQIPKYILWASVAALVFVTIDVLDPTGAVSAWRFDARLQDNPYRWNTLTSLLALIVPMALVHILHHKRQLDVFHQKNGTYLMTFLVFGVLASGGRAGILGLAAAGLVMWLYLKRYHRFKPTRNMLLAGCGAVVAALAVYVVAYGKAFFLARVTFAANDDGLGGGRTGIWADNWAVFTENLQTMLMGVGPKGYAYATEMGEGYRHAHNFVLQLLAETGLVGAAAFGAVLILVAIQFSHFAKRSLLGVGAMGGFVAFVVAGQFNFSIFNLTWLLAVVVALLIGWRCGWAPIGQQKRTAVLKSRPRKPSHLSVVPKPTGKKTIH